MKRRKFLKIASGFFITPLLPKFSEPDQVYDPKNIIVMIGGKPITGFSNGDFFESSLQAAEKAIDQYKIPNVTKES